MRTVKDVPCTVDGKAARGRLAGNIIAGSIGCCPSPRTILELKPTEVYEQRHIDKRILVNECENHVV